MLFDEVELIGRYSLLQRGKSYAELARWSGAAKQDPSAPLATVLALTDDFEAAVLVDKDDRGVRLDAPGRTRPGAVCCWCSSVTSCKVLMA